MNAQNAAQFLPLVQALADGKTIQLNGHRGWEDVKPPDNIGFNFPVEKYRIKPEPPKPREYRLWVTSYGHAVMAHHDNSLNERSADAGWSEIIVREVLPETP